MRIPQIEPLDNYFATLAQLVADTSYLPHPKTVATLKKAVFPTSRVKKQHPRLSAVLSMDGTTIGMYDDNQTPEWAIFWAHGLTGTRPKGWVIAHIWSVSDDITSYTHLANLAMVPECFASLTDKSGPLTTFLRWHSRSVYGWKPETEAEPEKPTGYDKIRWKYLPPSDDPNKLIWEKIATLDNKKLKLLIPLMKRTRIE